MCWPSRRRRCAWRWCRCRTAAIACSAFSTRLSTTCWISSRLTKTGSGAGLQIDAQGDIALREVELAQVAPSRARSDSDRPRRGPASRAGRTPAGCGRSGRRARLPAARARRSRRDRRRGLLLEHQLDAADDRLQRIVDLVRDAGHELADRRQPLAVHQLIAQPQLLGDIALDADEVCDRPDVVAERDDRARRREGRCRPRAGGAACRARCPSGALRGRCGRRSCSGPPCSSSAGSFIPASSSRV